MVIKLREKERERESERDREKERDEEERESKREREEKETESKKKKQKVPERERQGNNYIHKCVCLQNPLNDGLGSGLWSLVACVLLPKPPHAGGLWCSLVPLLTACRPLRLLLGP